MNIIERVTAFSLVMMLLFASMPLGESAESEYEITGTPEGWSDDVRMTNNSRSDVKPAITSHQEHVYIAWEYRDSGKDDVYLISSSNHGQHWNSPTRVSKGLSGIYCNSPDIAIYENQDIHVVWQDNDAISIAEIKYRHSPDGGQSWLPEKMISSDDGSNSEAPKIAVSEDGMGIHVVWVDSRHGIESSPPNTELYYNRSLDGGVTWEGEQRLTNAPYYSSYHQIAVDGSTVHILWSDARFWGSSGDLYYKVSYDNGENWSSDILLAGTPNSEINGAIAVNGNVVHVAWVNDNDPVYTLYYRNSTDNGANWNPVRLLSGPSTGIGTINLAVSGDNVYAVWSDIKDVTSSEIYYINSTDGGITWKPEILLTANDGLLSNMPKIAVDDSKIHVTWRDNRDGNAEIYYKRYPDFPDTTPPIPSNETPLPDSYKDAPGTNVSVHVTDPSGVNASTVQLWVNGNLVPHTLTSITDGYNVSWASGGFSPGIVTCRIVAEDVPGNLLDYTWNFTVLAVFDIPLHIGWNLISLPFEQVDDSVESVLLSIYGKYETVKYYDTLDYMDHWKTYRPGGTANDLTQITHRMGIWVKATEQCNLTVRGNITGSTAITLYAGWNLVGYPSMTNQTVANALWGTGADRVEVYQSETPYIRVAESTYMLKPGEGFWVRVTADTLWIIDW